MFLFAGPVISDGEFHSIGLQESELADARWAVRAEFSALLHPAVAARVTGTLHPPGGPTYREIRPERTET
ncbi:NUDIX hydrolase [Peterkaempfera bronchialis]|uniref:Uncharacterized protein n=1 Tax=Peterkaempfera bronchialis TaxID=2126346 RepID=A0A345SWR3_9ACTN|nr:hypothetical protein [Peterkaempfera bronchialis]AXI78168.1 hypothetical protein C7M71_012670 [Peterkaempfera bronchialis]